jgi:hypothetical protein
MTADDKPKGWNTTLVMRFLEDLVPRMHRAGFGVGLTGSLLLESESRNDLDIILYPLNSGKVSVESAQWVMDHEMSMRRTHTRGETAVGWEQYKGSTDMKNVEKWVTKEGRQVDVFHLR